LAKAHGWRRVGLDVDVAHPSSAEELARFEQLLQRRGTREPVAYILGAKDFSGRAFEVPPGVFIPRPETELLVQLAIEALPKDAPARVLDLCAGSGAVGVTIAAERPVAQVDLVEIALPSVEAARSNVERLLNGDTKARPGRGHPVPDKVRVLQGDLFA